VQFSFLNLLSVNNVSNFGSPEIRNELLISFILNIEFSDGVIFELWVVLHFLWDSLSSEEPDSFDFEVWFFSEHAVHGEGVLPEVVNSLEETVQEVGSLIDNLSFSLILFVVDEVD